MAKRKSNLKDEVVYSTIEDKNIKRNLKGSKIWKECYHLEDLPENFEGFVYKIAFDGLTPVQVKDIKKY